LTMEGLFGFLTALILLPARILRASKRQAELLS
jgi:hypothetical protein